MAYINPKSKVANNKPQTIKEILKCPCCGVELKNLNNQTYASKSRLWGHYGRLLICKSCIDTIWDEFLERYSYDVEKTMYYLCMSFDYAFHKKLVESSKKSVEEKGGKVVQKYLTMLNSFGEKNGYADCFKNGEKLEIEFAEEKNEDEIDKPKRKRVLLSDEDKKSQSDVKRLLGYDPFLDYETNDKVFLCNDLVTYLDEDTVDDAFKCSVVLQIVNNNNQIRKIDIAINQLSSDIDLIVKNSKEIDSLTSIKQKLNQANDKLSKENNIALKHRDGNGTQNSTLGSMMKKLRELNFEKAEHDYYDMCKSYGIRQSADISNKSIMEILHFDDNDMNNMFKMQREELQKLQDKELDYKEQIRLLIKENNELKKK